MTRIPSKSRVQGLFADDEEDFEKAGSGLFAQTQDNDSRTGEDEPLTFSAPNTNEILKQKHATSTSGRTFQLKSRHTSVQVPYEQLIAKRSSTEIGRATKSFYGIEVHKLLEKAAEPPEAAPRVPSTEEVVRPSIKAPCPIRGNRKGRTFLWTEKYRAKKFTDLVGDERTHREVLRWVKHWDPIVFPGNSKAIARSKTHEKATAERPHRKILLLTGPPGLGKTTLAHVCARQAGYEVVEINATDERSRDVVKGGFEI